jgi:hypothetical protein
VKYIWFVFFLCFTSLLSAQPGGGGGLNISYLTNYYKGDTLDMDDAKLKINQFVLNRRLKRVKYAFSGSQVRHNDNNAFAKKAIYLPRTYDDGKQRAARNQRLEIIYGMDTMTIDFVGIHGENGLGMTEQLDQIRFTPGYFKMHLTKSERFDSIWALRTQFPDQIETLRQDMQRGIIPVTMQNLLAWKVLESQFNPKLHIFTQRLQREACEELYAHDSEPKTVLCERMIELSPEKFSLHSIQEPRILQDTLCLK